MSLLPARARPQTTARLMTLPISSDRLEIAVGGDREAGLDDVDAHLVEEFGDLHLLGERHRRAGRLLAVAQGGVENDDAVLLGARRACGCHRISPSRTLRPSSGGRCRVARCSASPECPPIEGAADAQGRLRSRPRRSEAANARRPRNRLAGSTAKRLVRASSWPAFLPNVGRRRQDRCRRRMGQPVLPDQWKAITAKITISTRSPPAIRRRAAAGRRRRVSPALHLLDRQVEADRDPR